MQKSFKIKSKVWRWPGDAGWHFVNVDKKISKKIRDAYPKGFVSVHASIGKTSWDTALFPQKQSEAYLISIKAAVRKKEGILEGDMAKINFTLK